MDWTPNFDDKILKKLKSIKLNQEQQDELARCMEEVKWYAKDVFEDIYKLYISGMSPNQIAQYYNRGADRIRKLFEYLGISRSRKESQMIAAKNRNYPKIRKTFKKTIKERYIKTQLFGSDIENLIRVELNQELNDTLNDDYEIIVGINTVFGVGELDIPIIIIKKNNFYKFGIEVDNNYIHKNRKQKNKLKVSKFKNIGYHILKLDVNATICNDGHIGNIGSLKDDVKSICDNIVNVVKK